MATVNTFVATIWLGLKEHYDGVEHSFSEAKNTIKLYFYLVLHNI